MTVRIFALLVLFFSHVCFATEFTVDADEEGEAPAINLSRITALGAHVQEDTRLVSIHLTPENFAKFQSLPSVTVQKVFGYYGLRLSFENYLPRNLPLALQHHQRLEGFSYKGNTLLTKPQIETVATILAKYATSLRFLEIMGGVIYDAHRMSYTDGYRPNFEHPKRLLPVLSGANIQGLINSLKTLENIAHLSLPAFDGAKMDTSTGQELGAILCAMTTLTSFDCTHSGLLGVKLENLTRLKVLNIHSPPRSDPTSYKRRIMSLPDSEGIREISALDFHPDINSHTTCLQRLAVSKKYKLLDNKHPYSELYRVKSYVKRHCCGGCHEKCLKRPYFFRPISQIFSQQRETLTHIDFLCLGLIDTDMAAFPMAQNLTHVDVSHNDIENIVYFCSLMHLESLNVSYIVISL